MGRRSFLTIAFLLATGCGPQAQALRPEPGADAGPRPAAHADLARGYSVSVPEGWFRPAERMSHIDEPRELLSLSTVPLRWRPTNCEAFAGAAGSGMGPDDVVITVWERGYDPGSDWPGFPARPARFGPVAGAEPAGEGCGEPTGTIIHWRNFSERGRHFHTLVRIGPDAPDATAAQAWRILDGLRLEPGYRPDWPARG
jgi:hypothetical protein